METFGIYATPLLAGQVALGPCPGRWGDYAGDLARVIAWGPGLVLSMVEDEELARCGASSLAGDLHGAGVSLHSLPVRDFSIPKADTAASWPAASTAAQGVLAAGGRVFIHCFGGCGRSGMAALRLMVEGGEAPASALARLRAVRACAVETAAQRAWASIPAAAGD